jgi:hypothetical protein
MTWQATLIANPNLKATSDRPADRWFDARDEIRQRFSQLVGRDVSEGEFGEIEWVDPVVSRGAGPLPEQAELDAVFAKLTKMTPQEIMIKSIETGIHLPNGKLAPEYGGGGSAVVITKGQTVPLSIATAGAALVWARIDRVLGSPDNVNPRRFKTACGALQAMERRHK